MHTATNMLWLCSQWRDKTHRANTVSIIPFHPAHTLRTTQCLNKLAQKSQPEISELVLMILSVFNRTCS